MLKRIATQVSGRMEFLYIRLWAWVTTCRWSLASSLPARFIRKFQNAINLLNPLAQTVLNFKAWVVNQTTAAQLTKQGRSTAKAKAIQIGSQLRTTVLQTLQYANLNQLQSKGLVVKMKLALLCLKGSSYALIRIVRQWIQAGLKLLGRVNPHRLAAYLLQQLEKVRVTLTNWVLLCIKKLAAALTLMGNRLKAIGLKLQGNAHLLLQRVLRLQSLSKKLAEKTKLAQSLLKKAVAVLTRMVYLLRVIGLKQVGTVHQPQQPARRQRSKGH
jgi:hypothetical protein